MARKLIFEKNGYAAENGYAANGEVPLQDPGSFIPSGALRKDLPLPDVGELQAVRHYLSLAKLNFSVDTNFYPLGSCTMKYNP
ncbi:MAG: aminomethyl-transferring glycine dehydrogenase subunit GcvPB, partial [Candidatus Aureabacteria bacterium]|nr:aminomethyl-transferring glycine dehydrogenase subunit GcvPB [Candidatus Auribacterota bacterium]